MSFKIFLKCLNNSHEDILLPDGVAVVVGRSKETKIQDKRCSRKQLELAADYNARKVFVKQLGPNPARVEDVDVSKGSEETLEEGQTLYFVEKDFPHHLLFRGADSRKLSNKRTISDYFSSDENLSKKSKKDEEDEDSENEKLVKTKLEKLQNSQNYLGVSRSKQSSISSASSSLQEVTSRDPGWYEADKNLLVFESDGLVHSSKIVAFDMDGTLITTKSGRTFAADINDWKILFPEIPKKLKELSEQGHKLVIITNQMGIGKGKVKKEDFKTKVENLVKFLFLPFQVLAITDRGFYRKPNTGTWKWLDESGNGGIPIDKPSFVYVGDAAGREKGWAPGKKKDFSCSDRLFAINLDVTFFTPEEFFLGHRAAKFEMPTFDPRSLVDQPPTDGADVTSEKQEVVILVGYPASGKSTFVARHLLPSGYIHINRDKLKTWQKCVSLCNSSLAGGKSVVIDNTNPDLESRQRYISCAKSRGCQCRCFVMQATLDHAMHNNRFRELSGSPHDVVPKMILYSYRKKFVEPKLKEGFDEIVKINFVPHFENDDLSKMYRKYTD
ncbi:bifunctional polynucleotide phosphatase/kinase-like [Clavelina lepadiformis]|uniref:bifunctional polynucleotide phosphatase/kinase-like n=1 Tax=Clavelina lepadiformis TaxID=159417 RepID=UPI0040426ED1